MIPKNVTEALYMETGLLDYHHYKKQIQHGKNTAYRPRKYNSQIMETDTTGGWKETTTRMKEQINETLHNTKNEYINPQQLKRYFRHNKKQAEEKRRFSARKYKLEGRGTTKIHEIIDSRGP